MERWLLWNTIHNFLTDVSSMLSYFESKCSITIPFHDTLHYLVYEHPPDAQPSLDKKRNNAFNSFETYDSPSKPAQNNRVIFK